MARNMSPLLGGGHGNSLSLASVVVGVVSFYSIGGSLPSPAIRTVIGKSGFRPPGPSQLRAASSVRRMRRDPLGHVAAVEPTADAERDRPASPK